MAYRKFASYGILNLNGFPAQRERKTVRDVPQAKGAGDKNAPDWHRIPSNHPEIVPQGLPFGVPQSDCRLHAAAVRKSQKRELGSRTPSFCLLNLEMGVAVPLRHIGNDNVVPGHQPLGDLHAVVRYASQSHLHALRLFTVRR